MRRFRILAIAVASLLATAYLAGMPAAAVTTENPLLAKWTGPYGGVPPFDRIKVEHFKPALEAGMAENLKEIDAIAANPAKPDFENTIAALERAGRTLARVASIFNVFSSTMADDAFQAVEREMAPKLAEFSDRITRATPSTSPPSRSASSGSTTPPSSAPARSWRRPARSG
jgi:peptidyl-dipeptidase Dcp